MRKLKLQVQISVNGYIAGPNGESDWMTWDWDDKLKQYESGLTDSVGTILLGRKMTDEFVTHWEAKSQTPGDPENAFAKKMMDYPKVVFTKTLDKSVWKNTTLAKGDITEEVNHLKRQKGKDIIVYGGAGFVSSLIGHKLIDEYYLFVNPAAISNGMTIFSALEGNFNLKLEKATSFDCGVVVLQYRPGK